MESWGVKIPMEKEILSHKCDEIFQLTQIPCFILGDVDTMYRLYECIVDYLSEL